MIESALRMGAVLIIGLACNATVAICCQAQDANDESNGATAIVSDKSANIITPDWSRSLKDCVLIAPPAPDPQITGPAGPTPTAQTTDRVKVREFLAPWREDYAAIRIGPKYINGIVGGFEQGSGLGLGVEFTTADKFSWVEFRATAIVSTLLHQRFRLDAYFPEIGDERTHANVWFNYLLVRAWNFYGIGPRTPRSQRTSFRLEERSYHGLLQRDFTKRFRAGVFAGLSNSGARNGDNDNVAPIHTFFSGNPAVVPITAFAPGLDMNAEISHYGLYGEYDGRSNTTGLTKGFYLYGMFGSWDGIDNGALFTDWGWLWTILDGRVYIPLGSNKTSFAALAFASLENPKGGSQIPFYYQSFIGGRLYLRGLRDFRFRANNALVLSAELRRTVWTQSDIRGLDIHAFGDGGQVWGDNRSKTNPLVLANDKFIRPNWRFGVGGGFTYRYNRAFAVRIELGHSNETNLVYMSLTRGF
ncbi:MAG TPA: BamA/TamA family outer membrane protein [Blastocatellia bacterium]|nr:BamA/TamA family outer membrane protein [Blastocatellia bacterium]